MHAPCDLAVSISSIRPSARLALKDSHPIPHSCCSQIPDPRPKIIATSAPNILAAGQRRRLLAEQAASAVASPPYMPPTKCRFVVVEPAAPALRHLPAEPTATAVFSWNHRPPPPPTISSAPPHLSTRSCCASFNFHTMSGPSAHTTQHKRKDPSPNSPASGQFPVGFHVPSKRSVPRRLHADPSEVVNTNEINVRLDKAISCDANLPASSHIPSGRIPTPRSYDHCSITQKATLDKPRSASICPTTSWSFTIMHIRSFDNVFLSQYTDCSTCQWSLIVKLYNHHASTYHSPTS
uniref:Uncharacterized protein n=1 Tax=Oryza punctata TaxID=4537 RepID=A0A0E0MLI6_ORYPU